MKTVISVPRRAAVSVLAAACGAMLLTAGEYASPSIRASERPYQSSQADDEQLARVTCGGCHAFPPPEILPRAAWREEFLLMQAFRENQQPSDSPASRVNRVVELPRDMEQVLTFFTSRAPARLPAPERWPEAAESPVQFARSGLTVPNMAATPAVSNVQLVDFDGDKRLDVLATDMRQGLIFVGHPAEAGSGLSIVAAIPHPAHVTLTDVDRDGVQDMLVADLGEFSPADHDRGAVIWLRGRGSGKFDATWLDGWPRVADVESADFNGDGKNDLAVAAFGWRKSGHITIVENRTMNPSQPAFANHKIDARPGGLHIVPADLNHDGRMDFVTVLAQQYETVLAYINKPSSDFSFDQKVIYTAPHPNWGSSGIQLVDLDKDGDLDVLLTHGDTFDDGIVKPYHGIQWLENTGGYPFVEHALAQMPGVHRAQAADLDGDGDLDVVASALVAGGSDVDEKTLPALVWLEQTRPGVFARHTIEMGSPRHATLDVGDIDGDGDIDIVVGTFAIDTPTTAWIDVWTNQRKKR